MLATSTSGRSMRRLAIGNRAPWMRGLGGLELNVAALLPPAASGESGARLPLREHGCAHLGGRPTWPRAASVPSTVDPARVAWSSRKVIPPSRRPSSESGTCAPSARWESRDAWRAADVEE